MKNKKIYFWTGFIIVALLILLRIGLYFGKTGFRGVSVFAVFLILSGAVMAAVFTACFAKWVYDDSEARGEEGFLWALMVVLVTPVIGIMIYLISRKGEKRTCPACGYRINRTANYCEYCGVKMEQSEGGTQMKTKKKGAAYLITGMAAAAIMIVCLGAFTVKAFMSDDDQFLDKKVFNTGVIYMSSEMKWKNDWKLNFKSASDGYRAKGTFKVTGDDQVLYADINCGEGELLMHITQGGKEEVIDVSSLEERLEIPMESYDEGKILVELEIKGAKNTNCHVYLE